METNKTILLTGAAGFIGSYLLGFLNKHGYRKIIIADHFNDEDKWFNFDSKHFEEKIDRDDLFNWLGETNKKIDLVIHLGARTNTAEFDYTVLEKLNVAYSKQVWNYCTYNKIPLIYASSAATYGSGELSYKDDHDLVFKLHPLNPYGTSKNEFDKWALSSEEQPPAWYGLKFFNVYGPNEYHKARMASMVFHGYNQIRKTGKIKLFKSHRPDFKDGEQLRDFIYVEDIAKICHWLTENKIASGLYNAGTGKSRSFNDLANAVFSAMNKKPVIEYIDMPEDIRESYQYFTEADMEKLIDAGYDASFYSLEEGVEDYVKNYLSVNKYY
jgi:ADP-L-glycero-D-manno-heptose 6-epimerase